MILDHFRLDGRVALITGGGTGLGQAVAVALAEAGADIAILYPTRPDAIRQAVVALKRRWMGAELDLKGASVTQLQGAVQQVASQLGRLDILINCTESTPRPPALEYAESDWDGLQVDLKAAFFLSQAAARHFRTVGHGKVINIGAMLTEPGEPQAAAHAATLSTLLGLTRQLARQWAPLGINVNCIVPGYMRPAAEGEAEPPEGVPAQRWGSLGDVQTAAVYLASPASDYVHGLALYVDGGWAAR